MAGVQAARADGGQRFDREIAVRGGELGQCTLRIQPAQPGDDRQCQQQAGLLRLGQSNVVVALVGKFGQRGPDIGCPTGQFGEEVPFDFVVPPGVGRISRQERVNRGAEVAAIGVGGRRGHPAVDREQFAHPPPAAARHRPSSRCLRS